MNDVDLQIENKPGAEAVNNPRKDKKNPYTLWFVVLSFVTPVVLAYVMFFFVDIKSFSNHGEILNPIVPVAEFKLKNDSGEIIPDKELTAKWRIISFLHKDCDQQCQKRLFDTRQIYTSLGKDRDRAVRMFVHLQPADDSLLKLIAETHPNVVHVNGERAVIIKALGDNAHIDVGIDNNETYIMDPLGNVMMRFTQDQPNKDFLQDLRKLLKVSQIG
jgi:cytochrome oxidase Cu insertion factor (SCO1/SenC/PrrC family)